GEEHARWGSKGGARLEAAAAVRDLRRPHAARDLRQPATPRSCSCRREGMRGAKEGAEETVVGAEGRRRQSWSRHRATAEGGKSSPACPCSRSLPPPQGGRAGELSAEAAASSAGELLPPAPPP
ncbi:unnamed protein product, partial [Urochloa humidicola]